VAGLQAELNHMTYLYHFITWLDKVTHILMVSFVFFISDLTDNPDTS